ncbi:photosynthetic NDH subunit of lumenal location 3, chloroplastic-like [Canna indica]|uniref:Photosynthetic NDH subunit of lumenal location 3, chloroplastic-like n=1 Tax=Canna indica TaxID=4628 RepID=A0AAQ3QIV2_9LILI|nr:photosynthetic NDH subunit of lumenal location 3, chloroplastic-like [Canna indica]
MEGLQWKGCVYRIRKCVVDLLSMEDDLMDEDEDEDAWELMGSDLRLKSTFLYCDLNQVISNAREERKKVLTDLANKLFYYMEELDNAVKSRSISSTQVCYNDTVHVLQEVMAALMPLR